MIRALTLLQEATCEDEILVDRHGEAPSLRDRRDRPEGKVLPAPLEDDELQRNDLWSGERARPPVKAIKSTLRGTGELMITFGLVILLFAAYEVWGKTAIVDAHQNQLNQQLEDLWANPDPTVSAAPTPVPTGASYCLF